VKPRRPFAKDTLLRNYDVDSAEEWEDEDAGEDICDSGEEDEGSEANEPDELVFDEFFRHDDDFGSDAENENMGGAPTAAIKRPSTLVKSSAGPRFVTNAPIVHQISGSTPVSNETATHFSAFRVGSGGSTIACTDDEKDVSKLLPFFTVVYPAPVTIDVSTTASPTVTASAQSGAAPGENGEDAPVDASIALSAEKGPRKMSDAEVKAFFRSFWNINILSNINFIFLHS
jgi:hypothetical protein